MARHVLGTGGQACPPASGQARQAGEGGPGGLVSVQDVQAMLIDAGGVTFQPPGGRALINAPVYYLSGARQQEGTVSVLGREVTIRAWPVSWTWDTGDGTTFTTSQPGAGWPDSPVQHTYRHAGQVTVTVTVSWQATYTLDGMTYPVTGTATTRASATLELYEAEAVLTN